MKKLPVFSALFLFGFAVTVCLFSFSSSGDGGTTLSSGEAITPLNSATQEAQSTQTGSAGQANQRTVVNLKDIASQETLSPPGPKAPKVIHRPLPDPKR